MIIMENEVFNPVQGKRIAVALVGNLGCVMMMTCVSFAAPKVNFYGMYELDFVDKTTIVFGAYGERFLFCDVGLPWEQNLASRTEVNLDSLEQIISKSNQILPLDFMVARLSCNPEHFCLKKEIKSQYFVPRMTGLAHPKPKAIFRQRQLIIANHICNAHS